MDKQVCLPATATPAIATSTNVAFSIVVQDDGLNIKEEGADTHMDIGPTVLQHMDAHCRPVQRTVSCVKEERDPLEETSILKREPLLTKEPSGLQVNEYVAADSQQDMDRQCCLQATDNPAIASSMNLAAGGVFQDDALNMKEEWADTHMDIGPTVLQHMDTRYSSVQKDMSVVKQERTINHHNLNPILCGGVKEEIIEDEWRADTDDQRSNKAAHSNQRAQSQLYSCDKCGKTYTKKNSLMNHTQNLHSTQSHECTKCDKKFPSKAYLHQHTGIVHSEQQYECAVCKKIYGSKLALCNHVYQFHRPRPAADTDDIRYSCDKCLKTYASKYSLMAHYRNLHSTESHECTECNKKFPSKQYLYMHTSSAHSEQQYECAVCKKICRSKMALNQHVNCVHRPRPAESHQPYACANCGKNFNLKRYCREHEKRGKCRRPTASNKSAVASTSEQQHNVVVKAEPADGELELGPDVFQHMDCNYRPYKQEPGLD